MPVLPALSVPDTLEPSTHTINSWMESAARFMSRFVEGLDDTPAIATELPVSVRTQLLRPPPDRPGSFEDLLGVFGDAARYATEMAGPRHFGYIPGGGLVSSAIAELLARTVNRFTSVAMFAPGLVAMEHGVLRWLCTEFGLPGQAGGLVTTGASMATLSAVVAARHDCLGEEFGRGTMYITEHTNHTVPKAAMIAGIRRENVRVVPTGSDLRMDFRAAARMIAADRAAGRRPFLLVATAGTTSTGTVDPLLELATLARREDLWLHVDAAYGGFFQLTRRGRERLVGIAAADSIALDPHKGLFLPHGTGVLLVRDAARLRAAHTATDGAYLPDFGDNKGLPNFTELGPELTREFRGLRLWLPLHLHGVAAFRRALDEKLDLAVHVNEELHRMSGIHVPWRPELSTVAFRDVAGNTATQRLLARIHDSGRVFLSSTKVRGLNLLRMCVLSHRTQIEHVNDALDIIRAASRAMVPCAR